MDMQARAGWLTQSKLRFQPLMENSPLAVVEWSPDHRVTSWQGGAERMFGWTQDEIVGKGLRDWRFVHEDDWPCVMGAVDAMAKGRGSISRNRNYRKNGEVIHCEWYNSAVLGDDGALTAALSLVLDVTDKKNAEEALRMSEENFRAVFEAAPIGIFQSTVAGRFIRVNARLAAMYGYGSPQIMLDHIDDIASQMFVNPSLRPIILQRVLAANGFVQEEVGYRRVGGSEFLTNLHVRAVRDAQGGIVCLEGFVEDITERRKAEETIREAFAGLERRVEERTRELSSANERLQELDRLKSQFLASMSHELRTPLNSIIGFTSLLRRGLSGPVSEEQTKQLDIIYGCSKHLLALINDLLDVSRIEAGRTVLQREQFDFVEVAHEVVRSLEPQAGRKGLALVIAIRPAAIPMLGDRKRSLQVLLNLVNNSIKFTDSGQVEISAEANGGVLSVSVRDTGIGIQPEHLGLLFEAFRQVDSSARRVYEGAGLGLYLCRKLLHLMGGEVGAESEYGNGSRFFYTMPLELPIDATEMTTGLT